VTALVVLSVAAAAVVTIAVVHAEIAGARADWRTESDRYRTERGWR